jgi:two-component system, chemotaxis family, CheB/CheR fusion protein
LGDKQAAPATNSTHSSKEAGESSPRRPFPIVGIGASAGGLEACQLLLTWLPANLHMAYVFVPHLDPAHESAFRDILSRATKMPVIEVQNGAEVLPDHVYVIPRNCDMTISNGVLYIGERDRPRPVNTTIDVFLRSLAADQQNNSIGVILSGTASDGTSGLAAIKSEGGITFAQDSTAKYDGMPASAIASGSVDLVLPPDGIARELKRIAGHPHIAGEPVLEAVGQTREAQMAQVYGLLLRATRVDFADYKPPTIGRRISRRMALHKIEKLTDYIKLLQHDRNELLSLYQDLLINVTSFFRDAEAFETLKRVVYPELLKRHGNGSPPIRIWVPGCSTGEEAYSHAISLMEFLGDERTETPVQIFGTDLSENAIIRARQGLYKETIAADVSPIRLRRYFHRVESGYQISKSIRNFCIFSIQNVFSDPPFSRIDLASCRNVMIYLGQTLQRRVIPVFHYALNPGGFLMIGNSEGLLGSGADLFEIADRKHKIYRKKAVATPITFGFSVHMAEPHPEATDHVPVAKAAEPSARPPADVQREADRLLLARYAPPSVVVNEELEIVQTRGHTGPFLELPAGKMSVNLLKMARPGLLFDLQSAIDEARKTRLDAVRANVQVENNGGTTLTSLRVTPFKTPLLDTTGFLVAFELPDGGMPSASAEAVISPLSDDERTQKEKQIAQLRQELAATKEYLQSIIEALESMNEELQSANEEIQSGNEELQSTNEELQTSKEELESANEELHTVNDEMQNRNEMLKQLNNDLNNLLNSVFLPVVMLGSDLSVRRFTPQAGKVLGLTGTDIGRPIARLRLKMQLENLEQLMLDVISTVRPVQMRVRNAANQWCDLRVTPYRTANNRIDGVVLTLLIIDELEQAAGMRTLGDGTGAKAKEAAKSSRATKKGKRKS